MPPPPPGCPIGVASGRLMAIRPSGVTVVIGSSRTPSTASNSSGRASSPAPATGAHGCGATRGAPLGGGWGGVGDPEAGVGDAGRACAALLEQVAVVAAGDAVDDL